jgi:hypothetical protein
MAQGKADLFIDRSNKVVEGELPYKARGRIRLGVSFDLDVIPYKILVREI